MMPDIGIAATGAATGATTRMTPGVTAGGCDRRRNRRLKTPPDPELQRRCKAAGRGRIERRKTLAHYSRNSPEKASAGAYFARRRRAFTELFSQWFFSPRRSP